MVIRAKAKYEIGKTILHFPKLSREEYAHVSEGKLFEYFWKTELSGEFNGRLAEGYIQRNFVYAKEITVKHDGYYVSIGLDVNCLTLR